jgi:hypothetical protein
MNRLTPDITKVRVVRHGVLELTFADGVGGEVDVLDRMRGPVFAHARTPVGFAAATVGAETGTVVWPGELISRRHAVRASANSSMARSDGGGVRPGPGADARFRDRTRAFGMSDAMDDEREAIGLGYGPINLVSTSYSTVVGTQMWDSLSAHASAPTWKSVR